VRLFIAVWPPDEMVAQIAALARPAVPGLRWTSSDQWHITLRFLGSVAHPAPALAALHRLRDGVAVARLGPSVGRFGDRVLHVPVAGLEGLAAAVVAATADVGQPPDGRPFFGHITLARPRGRSRVRLQPLTGGELTGSWPVGEVTLVASTTHADGARYEILGRAQVPGEVP
jgi:2'-5' RNA ligase